nr:hypothetical protein GCM10020241_36500 [Streptoalloteichus tenebrarius]
MPVASHRRFANPHRVTSPRATAVPASGHAFPTLERQGDKEMWWSDRDARRPPLQSQKLAKGMSEDQRSDTRASTRTAPDRTAPDRTGPHRTGPHRTAPDRTAPDRTGPHRTAPHRTAPRIGRYRG